MKLNIIPQKEDWLSEDENTLGLEFIKTFAKLRRKLRLDDSPFLDFKIRDLKYETILLHRLARELNALSPAAPPEPEQQTVKGETTQPAPPPAPLLKPEIRLKMQIMIMQAMGKTMERSRKILRELERDFEHAEKDTPKSLAEMLQPIMEDGNRAYEEAVKHGTLRRVYPEIFEQMLKELELYPPDYQPPGGPISRPRKLPEPTPGTPFAEGITHTVPSPPNTPAPETPDPNNETTPPGGGATNPDLKTNPTNPENKPSESPSPDPKTKNDAPPAPCTSAPKPQTQNPKPNSETSPNNTPPPANKPKRHIGPPGYDPEKRPPPPCACLQKKKEKWVVLKHW